MCRFLGVPYTARMRVHAAVAAAALLSASVAAAAAEFPDITRAFEREAVGNLAAAGRVRGYPDGTFRPRAAITRAELLTIVYRTETRDDTPLDCFPDVPAREWFGRVVCEAKRDGVVTGYDDGLFRPHATVSVSEALAIVIRAFRLPVGSGPTDPWHARFTAAADASGLIDAVTYAPAQLLSRGLGAVLTHRGLLLREGSMTDDVREHRSSGCGAPAPESPPASVRVRDERRPFLLTVPADYTPRRPHGLVVAFHGRTNSNEQVRDYMRLDQHGDGFLIVYPQGKRRDDGSFSWSDASDKVSALRDIALFDAIVEEIGAAYCIDTDRVFVAGHSLGGWFADTLSCVRGDVVRGAAAVAGGVSAAACSGPTAALLLHHRDDKLVAFAQGEYARDEKIEQNNCSTETVPRWVGAFECRESADCVTGNPVVFCPSDLGHGYDGVGTNTHTWPRPAGEAIMEFFRSLP